MTSSEDEKKEKRHCPHKTKRGSSSSSFLKTKQDSDAMEHLTFV